MKCFSLFFFLKKSKIKHGFGVMLVLFFPWVFWWKTHHFRQNWKYTPNHILHNFKLYKNANFDRALIWMKVCTRMPCCGGWCRKGEISAYTNWGIIVHFAFAMKRKRYFFNLVPRVFFLNILLSCMQRSRLLFAGRKAHVGGHPGHNFSLPRVLKKLRRGEAGVLKPRFLKYWVQQWIEASCKIIYFK